jgi:hypothetical protein
MSAKTGHPTQRKVPEVWQSFFPKFDPLAHQLHLRLWGETDRTFFKSLVQG